MAMLPMKELNTLARASAKLHSLTLQVVRNIWCRKIWVNATKPLWSKVEDMVSVLRADYKQMCCTPTMYFPQ